MIWKDASSYSQGDQERIPQTWATDIVGIRFIVTRTHGFPDTWFTEATGILHRQQLVAKDIDDAKAEAERKFEVRIGAIVNALEAK